MKIHEIILETDESVLSEDTIANIINTTEWNAPMSVDEIIAHNNRIAGITDGKD